MNLNLNQTLVVMNALSALRFDLLQKGEDGAEALPPVDALLAQSVEHLDKNTPYGKTLDGRPCAYPFQKFSGIFGGAVRQHNCWLNHEEALDELQAAFDSNEYLFDPDLIRGNFTADDWQEGYDEIEHLIEMMKPLFDGVVSEEADEFNNLATRFEDDVEPVDTRI